MINWHRNWTINTIYRQWTCHRRFHTLLSSGVGDCQPPPRPASSTLLSVFHMLFLRWWQRFFGCLSWNRSVLLVSSGQYVVVRDNRQYFATHDELYPDSLHILSSIKDYFEYLFGAFWLFVISLHPFLVFILGKTTVRQHFCFKRHYSLSDVLMNRAWLILNWYFVIFLLFVYWCVFVVHTFCSILQYIHIVHSACSIFQLVLIYLWLFLFEIFTAAAN